MSASIVNWNEIWYYHYETFLCNRSLKIDKHT